MTKQATFQDIIYKTNLMSQHNRQMECSVAMEISTDGVITVTTFVEQFGETGYIITVHKFMHCEISCWEIVYTGAVCCHLEDPSSNPGHTNKSFL